MALLDARAGLGLVLEDDDLLAALLAQHLGGDRGAVDERLADGGGVAVGDEQDSVEGDGVAGADVQPIDLDLRAELDAVLLAAGFDDCVHGLPVRWSLEMLVGSGGRCVAGGHGATNDRARTAMVARSATQRRQRSGSAALRLTGCGEAVGAAVAAGFAIVRSVDGPQRTTTS